MQRKGRERLADRGAAAVETALVLPLLLMVVFAIIDFGRLLNAQIKVTEAAREGARALSLVSEDEAVARAGVIMGAPQVGGSDPAEGTWVGIVQEDCVDGIATAVASYQVRFGFEFITPLEVFAGFAANDNINITSTAVMPCRA